MAAGLLATTTLAAQTQVAQGVTVGKDYGVVYTLPKTEISIEIKATKVTYVPGEFSRYADRYLRLNDVSGDREEYWELKAVEVAGIGVPDAEQTYFIKMKDKTVAPLVELTADGLIKSINVPFAPQAPQQADEKPQANRKRPNPKDFLTEEILMANSTAKMAELVSKEIYSIRESRNALLRGQADNSPKDGEQLRLMLENLEAQERAMIEMFAGTRIEEEKIYKMRITPDDEIENEVLFRFSQKLGVLGKDDLAGSPIYIDLEDLHAVNTTEPAETGKKKGLTGVAYNVPGRAHVTVTFGKEKLFDDELPVTQFGIVEYLEASLFNKNATIKVVFNPATGGILKVDRE